ncbi:MAG TPA: IS110 family transposase [Verrucomicrobiae bacterium]|nr:IS110 family transposase [Verrucomicrobiae bacterium]
MNESLFAGIDLHSNNLMIGIVDQDGKRLKHQKLECDLTQVVKFLEPFKPRFKSLAVESTYNWYWLVDGLRERAYPVVLANPAQIEQYSGLKHADDKSDAFFLAELQRLGILPTGHIYDPQLRPVRDLLRRRLSLVQQRTALLLSFKSLYQRTTGGVMTLSRLKGMELVEAKTLYEHPANCLIAAVQKEHIGQLDQSIERIEKAVLKSAQELPCYSRLGTLPGIGRILGMTITMEVGEIKRFKAQGNLASYSRAVDSKRMSNGKKKGDNNGKCGNKYLAWAFVEAANFAKRYDEHCRRWFDRKAAKTSTVIATKALACKLAKAAWHVMAHDADYDPKRMFPELAQRPSQ